MKSTGTAFILTLLLVACGQSPSSFPPERVPDVEVTLPALQVMPMNPQAARSRLKFLALPAWTGPRTFGDYQQWRTSQTQLAVNDLGDVYLNTVSGGTGGVWAGLVRGYSSTGTSLGSGQTGGSKAVSGLVVKPTPPLSAPFDNLWHVQQTPTLSLVKATTFGRWYPTGEENRQGEVATLEVPNGIHVDETGFYDLEGTSSGIAFLDNTPTSQRSVNVYEASDKVGSTSGYIDRLTPVLYPKKLDGFNADRVQMDFSAGEYNEYYVVMAFPASECESAACPSLMNVQQVKDGRVQWSRVWRTTQPVKLRHVSANANDIAILMTVGASDPDTIAAQSQVTWVHQDGGVNLRYRVPLELWRRDWARGTPEEQYAVIPNLKFIQTDDHGKLTMNNENVIFSGTFSQGFSNIYLLDQMAAPTVDRGKITSPAVFSGEYVYATGSTETNLGQPSSTASNARHFLLPLDFELNER